MIYSQPSIKGVIIVEIKTNENASGALDHDQTNDVSCVFSSYAKWLDLGDPS